MTSDHLLLIVGGHGDGVVADGESDDTAVRGSASGSLPACSPAQQSRGTSFDAQVHDVAAVAAALPRDETDERGRDAAPDVLRRTSAPG
jgi:hypothetical protein